ncbi:hypothetical protein, partial [Streptomyces sp. NPDC001759]
MVLGLLTRPAVAAGRLAVAGPRLLVRGTAPAVGTAAGAVAGAARAGVRGVDGVAHVTRVARAALPGRRGPWRAGTRAHLALRPAEPDRVSREGEKEHLARRVAETLAERPDVAYAYWDGGLRRLVVVAAEEALGDRVVEAATEA